MDERLLGGLPYSPGRAPKRMLRIGLRLLGASTPTTKYTTRQKSGLLQCLASIVVPVAPKSASADATTRIVKATAMGNSRQEAEERAADLLLQRLVVDGCLQVVDGRLLDVKPPVVSWTTTVAGADKEEEQASLDQMVKSKPNNPKSSDASEAARKNNAVTNPENSNLFDVEEEATPSIVVSSNRQQITGAMKELVLDDDSDEGEKDEMCNGRLERGPRELIQAVASPNVVNAGSVVVQEVETTKEVKEELEDQVESSDPSLSGQTVANKEQPDCARLHYPNIELNALAIQYAFVPHFWTVNVGTCPSSRFTTFCWAKMPVPVDEDVRIMADGSGYTRLESETTSTASLVSKIRAHFDYEAVESRNELREQANEEAEPGISVSQKAIEKEVVFHNPGVLDAIGTEAPDQLLPASVHSVVPPLRVKQPPMIMPKHLRKLIPQPAQSQCDSDEELPVRKSVPDKPNPSEHVQYKRVNTGDNYCHVYAPVPLTQDKQQTEKQEARVLSEKAVSVLEPETIKAMLKLKDTAMVTLVNEVDEDEAIPVETKKMKAKDKARKTNKSANSRSSRNPPHITNVTTGQVTNVNTRGATERKVAKVPSGKENEKDSASVESGLDNKREVSETTTSATKTSSAMPPIVHTKTDVGPATKDVKSARKMISAGSMSSAGQHTLQDKAAPAKEAEDKSKAGAGATLSTASFADSATVSSSSRITRQHQKQKNEKDSTSVESGLDNKREVSETTTSATKPSSAMPPIVHTKTDVEPATKDVKSARKMISAGSISIAGQHTLQDKAAPAKEAEDKSKAGAGATLSTASFADSATVSSSSRITRQHQKQKKTEAACSSSIGTRAERATEVKRTCRRVTKVQVDEHEHDEIELARGQDSCEPALVENRANAKMDKDDDMMSSDEDRPLASLICTKKRAKSSSVQHPDCDNLVERRTSKRQRKTVKRFEVDVGAKKKAKLDDVVSVSTVDFETMKDDEDKETRDAAAKWRANQEELKRATEAIRKLKAEGKKLKQQAAMAIKTKKA